MKIIEINKLYHPWVGGVETHVKNIAEGLKSFATVQVVCCNTSSKTVKENINGINVTKYKSWGRLFSLPISFSFIKNFSKHNGDILHFHLPNPLAVMAYLLNPPKGNVIITWHSDIIKQKIILFFYKPFLKLFLKKAQTIIVTSPNMAKHSPFLKKHLGKVTVIPLGINPSNYPTPKEPITKKRFALFVGRFIYYKGVIELIKAMKQSNTHVIMIGEGQLENNMREIGEELIRKGQLTLLPFQDKNQLNCYFNACEFFILPSTHPSEAFGIVQLEAMIHSKALISTNLPTGVPWVNQHESTGIVIEPGNIQDLKKAMDQLWNNPELTQEYGKNAYKRCIQLFTETKMLEKTIDTISKIYNESKLHDI